MPSLSNVDIWSVDVDIWAAGAVWQEDGQWLQRETEGGHILYGETEYGPWEDRDGVSQEGAPGTNPGDAPDNNTDNNTDGNTDNNNNNQGEFCTTGCAPPKDCYAQCREADKVKTTQCRDVYKRFMEHMKTLGCPGVKCTMPPKGKSCRNIKRRGGTCAKKSKKKKKKCGKKKCRAKASCSC